MDVKIKLRNPDFCDGCEHLRDLATIGGHKRCVLLKKNMLPQEDITYKHGTLPRPKECKDQYKAEKAG